MPPGEVPFGMDFALFRLDPGVAADPSVCLFGGPTRLARYLPPVATVVHYYGAGAEFAERAPGRTGIVRTVQSADLASCSVPRRRRPALRHTAAL